jgi:SAM-dependent methyltransferase
MLRGLARRLRTLASKDCRRNILQCLDESAETVELLDCGCDDGEWTLQLGAHIGNVRLSGIEIVEERRLAAAQRGVQAKAADLNGHFPFGDGVFDVVHANQVIEHLSDTDRFVREIRRVLRTGGYAVISTENLASWHNILALVLGWQPFSLTNVSSIRFQIGNPLAIHSGEPAVNPTSWQHNRVFAYRGLKELFELHGLAVERMEGSGYYPLPGFLGKLDPRHAAFLTLKVRKIEE